MPRDYYSSDEEYDRIRIHRRDRSPAVVNYVQPRRESHSRPYYQGGVDALLGAQDRTMISTTRIREKSRERRSSPVVVTAPALASQGPVVIKQTFHDHRHSSDDDSSIVSSSRHHRRGRDRRDSSVYSHHSHSHSRSRAGSDAYVTLERYEMERKLDDMRRQLEQLRTTVPHSDRERYELERERERLRRERNDLELEAEQRDRERELEIRNLQRDKAELDRMRADDVEEGRLQVVRRDIEYRELREQQLRNQREKELEERRAQDLEEFELREARRKLQRIEEREKREKEALERAKEAKTQAELKAAKDELDKSKSTSLITPLPHRNVCLQCHSVHHPPFSATPQYTFPVTRML